MQVLRINENLSEGEEADLPRLQLLLYIAHAMYDDFYVTERWSGKQVHCIYQALIVAISTRHADAVDIKFLVDGQPLWIALPHPAWVEYKKLTGHDITDPLAVEVAGHYLRQILETGMESGREIHALSVDETLAHLDAVMQEFAASRG